jgi:SAM-dependent methyltransferase
VTTLPTSENVMLSPSPTAAVPTTLNLGCGRRPIPGAVNLDITADTNPDVVHNLDEFPWPFPNDRFDAVVAMDVIEHLDNVILAMAEIHRICRNGARVRIAVPHFSCSNAFTDPTHRHYFGRKSFDYITGNSLNDYYTRAKFRCLKSEIVFAPSLLNMIMWRLASRYPDAYEKRWAWMFPAWFLDFELEVIKDGPSE